MTLGTILIIILILLLIGAVPTWPYSRGWGYTPSGHPRPHPGRPVDPVPDGPNLRTELNLCFIGLLYSL